MRYYLYVTSRSREIEPIQHSPMIVSADSWEWAKKKVSDYLEVFGGAALTTDIGQYQHIETIWEKKNRCDMYLCQDERKIKLAFAFLLERPVDFSKGENLKDTLKDIEGLPPV